MAKGSKSSSGGLGCLLPVIIIVLIIIFIISKFFGGLGLGNGNGKGGNDDDSNKSHTEQTKDDDDNEQEVVLITVVKGDYFFENERIELEDFIKVLEEKDNDFIVKVKDDSATKDAYGELIEKLDTMMIQYVEE